MKDVKGNPIVMMNGHYTVAPGDAIYEDINHDGVINQYDIVYLGNSQPRFTGGAVLTLLTSNSNWLPTSMAVTDRKSLT